MSTLRASAEAAIAEVEEWKAAGENWPQWNVRYIAFRQEATPAKVLEMISENERLERNRDMWKTQVARQSEGMDVMRKALTTIVEMSDNIFVCECAADALIDSRK